MVNHDLVLNVGDTLTVTVADPKDRSTTAPGSNNNNYNEFKIAGGARRKTRKAGKKVGGAKRALSGFMRFSQKMRPEVMRENPGIAFGDVGRRLGEKWRSLSAGEKARY
jgi:structure-specific recognition protein 1